MDIFKSWLCTKPIAHRGLHDDQNPENSLSAFEQAAQKGYPIELDVREIDDNRIIVFHDDNLCRMTGHDGYCANLSLDKMQTLKLLNTDQKIPLLSEVLELVDGRVPILVEIKNTGGVGPLEKRVQEILKQYKGDYAVQSFNPYSMEYFKENSPNVLRGQLSCFFKDADLSGIKRFVLKRMMLNKISQPDFIAYEHISLPNRYVNRFKNLPVLAWTVRSNADMEQVKPHCSNIIFEGFIPQD